MVRREPPNHLDFFRGAPFLAAFFFFFATDPFFAAVVAFFFAAVVLFFAVPAFFFVAEAFFLAAVVFFLLVPLLPNANSQPAANLRVDPDRNIVIGYVLSHLLRSLTRS
jgi:hypothetical protein